MLDPQFNTRAELEAWAGREAGKAFKAARDAERQRVAATETIRRVTLAHVHLEK